MFGGLSSAVFFIWLPDYLTTLDLIFIFQVRIVLSHPDARGHSKASCHGSQDGDEDVQDFTPKLFVFHSLFELWVLSYEFFHHRLHGLTQIIFFLLSFWAIAKTCCWGLARKIWVHCAAFPLMKGARGMLSLHSMHWQNRITRVKCGDFQHYKDTKLKSESQVFRDIFLIFFLS